MQTSVLLSQGRGMHSKNRPFYSCAQCPGLCRREADGDIVLLVEGDRWAGARENRGWEGYWRREKKRREAGEKFKKASFRYLLLLTSSQRNQPNNVS